MELSCVQEALLPPQGGAYDAIYHCQQGPPVREGNYRAFCRPARRPERGCRPRRSCPQSRLAGGASSPRRPRAQPGTRQARAAAQSACCCTAAPQVRAQAPQPRAGRASVRAPFGLRAAAAQARWPAWSWRLPRPAPGARTGRPGSSPWTTHTPARPSARTARPACGPSKAARTCRCTWQGCRAPAGPSPGSSSSSSRQQVGPCWAPCRALQSRQGAEHRAGAQASR